MTGLLQFKTYPKRELEHINIHAEKTKKKGRLFTYNGKINLRSEDVAIEYFKSHGYDAHFSENKVWNKIFNRIVYKKLKRAYKEGKIKEFNRNILDDDFYIQNKSVINSILEEWRTRDLNQILRKKERDNPRSKMRIILNHLENDQVLAIMEYMAKDYIHHRSGFPDIMVWNSKELFFAEVKSKGDTLTKKQTRLHKVMLNMGIDVMLFTINLSRGYAGNQLDKYQHEEKANKSQYYERYKEKIEIANRKFETLKNNEGNERTERFKKELLFKGSDYFIAYLIVLDDLEIDYLNEIGQNKKEIDELMLKKENLIEKLRIMGKGRKLEDKKMFDHAIETYYQLKDHPHKHEAYRRICICLRKKKEYKTEIQLLKDILNMEGIPEKDKKFFKNRLNKLIKRRGDLTLK